MSKILIFFLVLIYSFQVTAQKSDKPIVIEADTLEYDKKGQIIYYKGNVIVKKDDFTLTSDTLKIFLTENGDVNRIVALGNVRFVKGNREGKSEKAEYFKNGNYIILKGNAELKQNNNIIEGDEIIYYIETEKAEVVGKKKRVRTIFFPDEKKENKK